MINACRTLFSAERHSSHQFAVTYVVSFKYQQMAAQARSHV